jgi:hypothetical protein
MNCRQHRARAGWLGRFARRHRPDRNPLRRGYDRLETAVLTVLAAAFLAAAPFAAQASADAAWSAAHQAQAVQQASRHQMPAVVGTLSAGDGYAVGQSEAQVRWTAPDGQARTGYELLPSDTRIGAIVRVWTDSGGQLTVAPLHGSQVANQAGLAGVSGVATLALVAAAAGILTLRVLDRRRMAAWETEWRSTGPRWTTRA